jgi:hypothetical protein
MNWEVKEPTFDEIVDDHRILLIDAEDFPVVYFSNEPAVTKAKKAGRLWPETKYMGVPVSVLERVAELIREARERAD